MPCWRLGDLRWHNENGDNNVLETYGDYDGDRTLVRRGLRRDECVANDGGDTEVRFYYDRQWRMVETRNGSSQTTMQMLPGTQYTDEWVWIEVNGDPTLDNDTSPDKTTGNESSESPADARYFVHQDRRPLTRRPPLRGVDRFAIPELRSVRRVKGNWNVIALSEYDPNDTNNGRIVERCSYTPYEVKKGK